MKITKSLALAHTANVAKFYRNIEVDVRFVFILHLMLTFLSKIIFICFKTPISYHSVIFPDLYRYWEYSSDLVNSIDERIMGMLPREDNIHISYIYIYQGPRYRICRPRCLWLTFYWNYRTIYEIYYWNSERKFLCWKHAFMPNMSKIIESISEFPVYL